jgi:hypothetical protein
MKLSDKISAPLGYARKAIAETISAVWTFTGNPEIRALGVDAGGTNGANHTFHSVQDNAGTPTDTYTRIGQSGGSVGIPIIQIRDTATEDRVAQWNFNLDSTIQNVEDPNLFHNVVQMRLRTSAASVDYYLPNGWSVVRTDKGNNNWQWDVTHSTGKTLMPQVSIYGILNTRDKGASVSVVNSTTLRVLGYNISTTEHVVFMVAF